MPLLPGLRDHRRCGAHFGTVIHQFLLTRLVTSLGCGMVPTALAASLIRLSGSPFGFLPSRFRAALATINVAAITPSTNHDQRPASPACVLPGTCINFGNRYASGPELWKTCSVQPGMRLRSHPSQDRRTCAVAGAGRVRVGLHADPDSIDYVCTSRLRRNCSATQEICVTNVPTSLSHTITRI